VVNPSKRTCPRSLRPYTVQDGEALLAEARRSMQPAAQGAFDAALAQRDGRRLTLDG
jgi:hypothetical protein